MRLHAEHRFPAVPSVVASALVDPAFASELTALPDVGSVEVVDHGTDADRAFLSLRLVYEGSVDGIAAKVLGPTAPSWVQTYRFDVESGRGSLEIVPETHASMIDCAATVTLAPDGDGTKRVVAGDLVIKIPLVGGKAERALGPGIMDRIDVEAALLSAWLTRD